MGVVGRMRVRMEMPNTLRVLGKMKKPHLFWFAS